MIYDVYQDGDDWVAKRAGSSLVSIVAASREDAIARAEAFLARSGGGQVRVLAADAATEPTRIPGNPLAS
ncbi:DUF2188 domain-containing protein [Leucobacter sp. M11]|uniref:DUF2188 domain-containing protein n=1 Tax=Leucobacter sp. M11 TaxID=2993565 RepID=UPI002D7E386C|nr:DUF2188 domain-containing protein [Leucobacter sp. M11]MEB4614625.1 DUF2188 domain-containing protein [Leucobacter sp. M11]